MGKREPLEDLSLLGGPLHRLGCRLGLALGLALGTFPWLVLLALVLVERLRHALFSIEAIGW